jgi:hypothetical protein
VLARVRGADVPEVERVPLRVAVAAGAIDPRVQVIRRHADRRHVVVAAGTARREHAVIDLRWTPGERSMTGVALLRRRDVRARHADRTHRVMAGRAGVRCHRSVVEARGCPRVGRMTLGAGGARGQVIRGLAGRDDAVVTARAVS